MGTIVSTFGAILNAAFAPEVAIILAVVAAVVGIGLAVLALMLIPGLMARRMERKRTP